MPVSGSVAPEGLPGFAIKNYLEGLLSGQQREWDDEYVHLETGERRWFHIVAMGSEVEGRTKHILVMSDRTADKQVNQALSDAVAAAETDQPRQEYLPFQYVPRYPHPHERHHRLYHAGAQQY